MSKFTSFVLGGLLGAGIALFLTPRTGEQNRALVTERANALAGEAKGFADKMPDSIQSTYRNAVDQGSNFVNSAVEKGTDLVNGAATRVKEVAGQVSDDANADELREKIEAARQRIASQVMENAEQSKAAAAKVTDAVEKAVEAAGKKVEDAADAVSEKADDARHAK